MSLSELIIFQEWSEIKAFFFFQSVFLLVVFFEIHRLGQIVFVERSGMYHSLSLRKFHLLAYL